MAALSVQVPYPVFYDRSGNPLDNGNIYIGVANLDPVTNPIQVYYDDALSLPASQPIKTTNGYIYRNGTPANIYVNASNFSILVRDAKNTLVYSFPDGTGISPNASGVIYNEGSIGAVDRTVESRLQDYVSVKDFGAVGDGVTDDTAAIQAAFNSGATTVVLTAATFKITDTVTLPNNVNIDFDGGELLYSGTRDRVAFQVGTTTGNAGSVFVQNVSVRSATIDWSNTAYIGVRICSARRANVNIIMSTGFTIGFECYSNGGGYAYNYHLIQHLMDNKYAMVLTNDGASSYINENVFMGGRYGNTSVTNALGSSYGVWLRRINSGYQASNLNRWIAPCFELQNGVLGDTRVPFWFDNCGQDNTAINARYETGRGTFALLDGTTYDYVINNRFEAKVFGTTSLVGVTQTGTARQNFFIDRGTPISTYPGSSVSYDVFKAVKAYNATNAAISGGLHFGTSSAATPLLNTTNIIQRRNSVSFASSRTIGFFAKVTPGGAYVVSSETDPVGTKGRIVINCYDSNFVLLTNASATYPDLLKSLAGAPVLYTASYGGGYTDSVDNNEFLFQISSAVDYIRVNVAGGSGAAWLQSIRLQQLSPSATPILCFSGLDTTDAALFSGIAPGTGINGSYARGQIIHNAVAATGQPSYWQCVTAGRLAPAWAISTAYVVGAVVLNDTNKIYACTTAGTSAGAGGPTGTGTGIVDGTVVWDYIAPLATFLAGANLP